MKFIYIMMRGEYYSPPPAPPKPVEKFRRKRPAPKSAAPMADILPPEDYGAGSDTLGLSTGSKKEELDEDKQYVFVMFVFICLLCLGYYYCLNLGQLSMSEISLVPCPEYISGVC